MLGFILACRAAHKTPEKVTEFELTLQKTNKWSMLCLWTDTFHCAWEERGHRRANWIFDQILDFIHILIFEVDFRNTLFAQQTFLLEIKLNLPASKLYKFVFYNSVWPCWVIAGTPFISKSTLYMDATKSRLFQLLLLKQTCSLQLYYVVRRSWRM